MCVFVFVFFLSPGARHEKAVAHFDRYFRRSQPLEEGVFLEEASNGGSGSSGGGVGGVGEAGVGGAGGGGGRRGDSLLPPDTFSYTHLISSLEKLGRDRACVSALQEMRARGIKVGRVGVAGVAV